MINQKDIKRLINEQNTNCISIYISTHRGGKETLEGQDKIELKNQVKEVKVKLESKKWPDKEIDNFLKPITDILEDTEFWRNQSDGLAIFLSEKCFEKFTVPVHFKNFNYISNEFYLKPLLPLFNKNEMFYLLTLSEDDVHFYEGTKNTITELKLPEAVPAQLEDAVGYDYEQKNLQFRSGQQGDNKSGMYHGSGEGNAKELEETKSYYRAINDGIMTMIHDDQTPPLILCCQSYQFAIYKEVNTYGNIYSDAITTNPKTKNMHELHEEASHLLEPYFNKTKRLKKDKYSELIGTGKASFDVDEVISAAIEGKIDSLFVQNDTEIIGTYDKSTQQVDIQEKKTDLNTSLLNIIAMEVYQKDGSIYIMDKEDMPDEKHKTVNALFRY